MTHENESGIELLRRVVKLFDYCNETFNSKYTPEELIKLAKVCWESGWDFFPDQYTKRQLYEALTYGRAPKWDDNEKPIYEPFVWEEMVTFLSIHHVTPGCDSLTLEAYSNMIEKARGIWGDEVAAWLMDCFMPEGEAVEPGYEDSCSHYFFMCSCWSELEPEWIQFRENGKHDHE